MKKSPVVLLMLGVFLGVLPAAQAADVDPMIRERLAHAGRADVFVKMADEANLSAAPQIADRVQRLWSVHDAMTAQADRSQGPIREFLRGRGVEFTVFWINNSLFVRDADADLVDLLSRFDGVAYLRANRERPLIRPLAPAENAPQGDPIEWGVARVNAPDVWGSGATGEGVVVANIDTGVRWTHDALINQYRAQEDGNHHYDWWDPDGAFNQPTDNNGHGTHTMGTMVGYDGAGNVIGVAPGARWIAAQGCDTFFCSDFDLTSSAQWVTCPTDLNGLNPDCSKAPHIVNNSWGGGGGDPWYTSYVSAWIAAGIVPVFSAGNNGAGCSTLGSPGDYRNTIGVASTDSTNTLSSFSSRGPSAFAGRTMPDISAPGSSVRSASNTADNAYAILSGTSMASPHVAGGLALLISKNPGRTIREHILSVGANTCTAVLQPPTGSLSCGGRDWNDFPSHHYGWGLLDLGAASGVNGTPCL